MLFKKMLPIGAAALLVGCASLPADRGLSDIRGLVKQRSGYEVGAISADSRTLVAGFLSKPLTADNAVAVALLRSPVLRREYAQMGLAQADVLEASRLSNPTLSVSVLSSNAPGEGRQVGYGLVQNFTDLLFLSSRSRLVQGDLARLKQEVSSRILNFAADVRQAHLRAVSAEQVAQMRAVIAHSAEASAELAKRFHSAGNINELEWKREQAAGTQARLAAEAAQAEAHSAKLELNALMGLRAAESNWTLATALPLPIQDEDPLDKLQAQALEQRLDVATKRAEMSQVGSIRSLAEKLRWFGVIEVGIEGERETDGARLLGPTFSLQLPIFNQGQASMARIDATSALVETELAALESEVGIAVAQAYQTMLAAKSRVERHLKELIPQREAVVARTQELQNFMIVGQFELLVAKQEEYDAYQSYLEALRDYWLARIELARATGSQLPSDARIPAATTQAVQLPARAPSMDMGGHQGHSMEGANSMDHGAMNHQNNDHQGTNHGAMSGNSASPPEEKDRQSHGHEHHRDDSPSNSTEAEPSQPVIQETPHAPHN